MLEKSLRDFRGTWGWVVEDFCFGLNLLKSFTNFFFQINY